MKKNCFLRPAMFIIIFIAGIFCINGTGQKENKSMTVKASEKQEFVINNKGVLTKYQGPGGNVTVPKNVKQIGKGAFEDCKNLTSVTIPDGVTKIGADAFAFSDLADIQIPNSVTEIKEGTFRFCKNISNIDLPDSITTIGMSAFFSCTGLESVTIPDSVTLIDDSAFANCSSLTSIKLPNSVSVIKSYAFSDCSSLTDFVIPNSVTTIEDGTFSNSGLETITIPKNVSEIKENALDCPNLKEIVVKSKNKKYMAQDGILYEKLSSGLKIVRYPAKKEERIYRIPEEVKELGKGAFLNCSSLEEIVLSKEIGKISENTFSDCSSLRKINIPEGVTNIENHAFYNCSNLEELLLPKGLKEMGFSALSNCNSLSTLKLPASLKTIVHSYGSFWHCKSLKNVTITVPKGRKIELEIVIDEDHDTRPQITSKNKKIAAVSKSIKVKNTFEGVVYDYAHTITAREKGKTKIVIKKDGKKSVLTLVVK